MKRFLCLFMMVLMTSPVFADEEKISRVHKILDLDGLFSRKGDLQESIAVETLMGVPAVVLEVGESFPASRSVKFGITEDCHCSKFRLYRISQDEAQVPVEVSYDAVRGFSQDNQSIEVLFEITKDRKIKLSIEVDTTLESGQMLEWMPVKEMVERDAREKEASSDASVKVDGV